jgi:hypothetical protein
MSESTDPKQTSLGRREALGLLGFLALAACGSSASSSGKATATTAAPPTTKAPASSATPSTAPATSPTTAPVVLGSNTALDAGILASDASSYNGAWSGAWQTEADGAHAAASGTASGAITIDAKARTLTAAVERSDSIVGGGAIPKFTIVGHVDSFTYNADSGAFAIHQQTAIGDATLTNGAGPGGFRLTLANIPGHPDVQEVVATGVANRPDAIPAGFTITYRDGSTVHGSITFTPGKS